MLQFINIWFIKEYVTCIQNRYYYVFLCLYVVLYMHMLQCTERLKNTDVDTKVDNNKL